MIFEKITVITADFVMGNRIINDAVFFSWVWSPVEVAQRPKQKTTRYADKESATMPPKIPFLSYNWVVQTQLKGMGFLANKTNSLAHTK